MLRRRSWRWLTIATLALLTTAVALPATSSAEARVAPRCAFGVAPGGDALVSRCLPAPLATAGPQHVGWAYLNLNYCAPGMACIALYRDSTSAWSWSGTAWRPSSLRQGWAYLYPYTGSWRWAWTQDTGWVAVSGGRFELRDY